MDSDVGSAEWFSREASARLRMVGMAVIQAIAFGACLLLHLGMGYGLGRILPEDYHYLHRFLQGVLALMFSAMYLAIAVDTMVIFIPALGGLKDFVDGKKQNDVIAKPIQNAATPGAEAAD
jgi:hypothetical protein